MMVVRVLQVNTKYKSLTVDNRVMRIFGRRSYPPPPKATESVSLLKILCETNDGLYRALSTLPIRVRKLGQEELEKALDRAEGLPSDSPRHAMEQAYRLAGSLALYVGATPTIESVFYKLVETNRSYQVILDNPNHASAIWKQFVDESPDTQPIRTL